MIIQADNITKVFQARRKTQTVTAVSQLSLQVPEGEIFGLLGPNGAGKTTFIKVLLEICYPTSGSALLLDRPIGDVESKTRIGYLPENHRYPAYLTGEQVLRHFGRLSGLAGADLEQRISRTLSLVEMERWRKVKIRKYSKGMMQRIGLAQALVNDPKLVILDEPTDGVDPIGRKQIRDILVRLRDAGNTVFLNSHLLSEVELICDRVAILHKGKLVRLGTVRELTQQDHVYTVQVVEPVPEALRVQWEATRVPVVVQNEEMTFTIPDLPALNGYLDELRQHGALIRHVAMKRSSLEDLFINVIAAEEK
jgi:ABC-2 type transport system ATP-binding protein